MSQKIKLRHSQRSLKLKNGEKMIKGIKRSSELNKRIILIRWALNQALREYQRGEIDKISFLDSKLVEIENAISDLRNDFR
jgi:hypothetical protein